MNRFVEILKQVLEKSLVAGAGDVVETAVKCTSGDR
jgi:hypothetical protein